MDCATGKGESKEWQLKLKEIFILFLKMKSQAHTHTALPAEEKEISSCTFSKLHRGKNSASYNNKISSFSLDFHVSKIYN